ncbi:leukocyte receptor cluster member 9-like [Asterias amurensis]|uniref:leukocyte receptor cluster member 9-like n=1 Tax=Asterias amurensis TaxID=7602 RepID=UPI003AB6B5C4
MAEASAQPTSCFSEDLSNELQALRSIFTAEGEISVDDLGPGGDYCFVVQLKPRDIDVGLQFLIPESYPKTIPKVEILPKEGETCDLHDDDPGLTQLLEVMYRSAKDFVGEPMMYSLLDVAKNWLEESSTGGGGQDGDLKEASVTDDVTESRMIPGEKKAVDDEDDGEYQKKGKDKKKKKKKCDDEGLGPDKKPRMKTASEVISRIQWDRQLRQEDFIVGYLDRFVGIVEKLFTAFSWVDVATVDDYETLAIPRHRIQYFKYKDQIVWDKTQRLDDVFGSTGSGKTILSTVEMFSKENKSVEEKETIEEAGHEAVGDEAIEPPLEVVATPWHQPKKKNFNQPNYFFAVRITDHVIRRCISRIQDAVCENNPLLEDALSNPSTLHVTLCTLCLDTPQQKAQAVDILKSLQQEISSMLSPVTMIRFQGLAQPHQRVLYAAPDEESVHALRNLSQTILSALRDSGLNLAGNHSEYNPHLTLLKLNRSEASNSPIYPDLYKRFQDAFIGVQPIDAVHLCAMKERSNDGFYQCLASMDVQSEH